MSDYSYADYVREAHELIDAVDPEQIAPVCDTIEAVYRTGHTLFVCGNGGSAANASHFAEDMATLMLDVDSGTRLKTVALTDPGPFIMAVANDYGYDQVFERQLMVQASPGDALLSITGSGNSANVIRATEWAHANGLATIGITGYDGGKLAGLVDCELRVPSFNMGMLECIHLLVLDFVVKELRFRGRGIEHPAR